MQKDKIIFFGRLPPPFTGENIVSDTIIRLLNNNYSIHVINISLKHEKKNSFYSKIIYHANQVLVLIKSYIELYRVVRSENFKFLYFSGSSTVKGSYLDFILLKIARSRVKKAICHLHNSTYKNMLYKSKGSYVSNFLIHSVDTFICLSNQLSSDLNNFIPASKRTVLPNLIDRMVVFSDEEIIAKLNAKKHVDTYIVTYISNFIVTKGYQDLAEAVLLLPEAVRRKIKVRFVGAWMEADETKENFIRFINTGDLKNCIEYVGPIYDRSYIKQLLFESDIFCLPTYYPVEAQPLCIIEAMNAGNAIVSTVHASIPEYVNDGKDGFLIEKRNKAQLADAIASLCNRETLNQFAINSRNNFLNNFNEEKSSL